MLRRNKRNVSPCIWHIYRYFVQHVICGDSRKPTTYEKLFTNSRSRGDDSSISSNLADAIITDPPYCLLTRRRKGGDIRDPKIARNSKIDGAEEVPRFESVREYSMFTKEWLTVAIDFAKPSAMVIVWTNALGKQPIQNAAQALGCEYVGEYVWAKRAATKDIPANSTKNEVLLRIYESALVFRRLPQVGSVAYLPIDRSSLIKYPWACITGYHDEIRDNPSRKLTATHMKQDFSESEAKMNVGSPDYEHPCHKPLAVLEPLLRTWVHPGDVVLDCFSGSGAILNAARVVGASAALGIEILPKWAEKGKSFSYNGDK